MRGTAGFGVAGEASHGTKARPVLKRAGRDWCETERDLYESEILELRCIGDPQAFDELEHLMPDNNQNPRVYSGSINSLKRLVRDKEGGRWTVNQSGTG